MSNRLSILKSTLLRRFIIILFVFSALPIGIVSWRNISHDYTVFHQSTLTHLHMVADGAREQVLEFLNYLRARTQDFSSDDLIRTAVEQLEQRAVDREQTLGDLNEHLAVNKQPIMPESVETFVLDLSGIVIASSDVSQIGSDRSHREYFLKGQTGTFVSDIFRREATGETSWVVSTPLWHSDRSKIIGVLANRIDLKALSDITAGRRIHGVENRASTNWFGETGETYIVNRQKFMITESRFLSDVVLSQVVNTPPVNLALEQGAEMTGNYTNYRGVPISGASKLLHQPDWIILTEIDFSEALIPIQTMRNQTIAFTIILLLGLVVAGLLLIQYLILPIQTIVRANRALDRGDESLAAIPPEEIPDNDLGEIMRSHNEMIKSIQIREQARLHKLSSVVEQTGDCVAITDRHAIIEYVNPAFEEITGYHGQDILGKNPRLLQSGQLDEGFYAKLWDTILSGKKFRGIFVNRKKNGEMFYEDKMITPLIDSQGTITHFVSTGRDITNRINTEKALEEEHVRLMTTLRSIAEGVIAMDTSGKVTFVNHAAERLIDRTHTDALGHPLAEVFNLVNETTHEAITILHPDTESQDSDGNIALQGCLLTKEGPAYPIVAEAAPLRTRDRQNLGTVLVFRDVSETRRLETEMLRTEKLESLGILADGLAHDFNNFLMTILLNISSARLIAKTDEKVQEVLKAAEHAIDRAKAITRQLSTFTRGGKTMKDTVYLTPLLKEAVQFALHGTRVRPEFHLAHDLSPVHIDSGQINQVINNLVINAMQAMPQGGRLMISTSNVTFKGKAPPGPLKADEYVKVDVQDAGVGILPEIIGKIFDPYVTSKKEGTGLGLFSCFSILNQHQGWITVESELGQGSTFTFYLPAASEPAPTESRPVAES